MERKRTLDIIISAVIAIILWFYLINIVNPQKDAQIRYVPVSISGIEALEERGLAVAGDLNYTVNLSIVGARNDIKSLTADDFTATADIASLNKGTDHIIVKVAAPRGIAIEDIDTDNIEVVVEDFVSEEKAVRMHFTGEKEDSEITILHRSDETIVVSGARSDVDNVAFVLFDVAAEQLEDNNTKVLTVKGQPVDASSNKVVGITLATDNITITAANYTVKNLQLQTEIVGEPLYGELSISNYDIQSVIKVKGSTKALEGLMSIKADSISIEGIDKTTTYDLKANLPDGVYLSRTCPELKATIYIADDAKQKYEESLSSEGAITEALEENKD